MPFLFTCPHCQAKTQVDDQYSGQRGRCVSCDGTIQVPTFHQGKHRTSAGQTLASARVFGWVTAILIGLLILAGFLFAVVRFGGQTMTSLTNSREQKASMRNLEKIAKAMNAYAADHGTFPPPATIDSAGSPLHSWRVLILPYLDEEELYERIDLNLPWNHPTNQMITDYQVPSAYTHPGDLNIGVGSTTAYYLITGSRTLFPASGPLAPDEITDASSQTILVAEGVPVITPISWTEPVDLDFSKMRGKLAGNAGNEPGGLLEGGVAVVTVDGRGHFIDNDIEPEIFLSLVTPQGDERLRDDVLD